MFYLPLVITPGRIFQRLKGILRKCCLNLLYRSYPGLPLGRLASSHARAIISAMGSSLTAFLAAWGAALSTFLAAWKIYQDVRQSRGIIKIELSLREWSEDNDETGETENKRSLEIVLVNNGHKSVLVREVGFGAAHTLSLRLWRRLPVSIRDRLYWPSGHYEAVFDPCDALPKMLHPHEYIEINIEGIRFLADAKRFDLWARDSTGRYFCARRRSIERMKDWYHHRMPRCRMKWLR